MADLLTAVELEALDLTAKLSNLLKSIINVPVQELETTTPVPMRGREGVNAAMWACADNDWSETAQQIHVIQNKILAQAGARAYPERFRLMGDVGVWRRG